MNMNMPIAGEFTSAAGYTVKVRCATVAQVVAFATASGSAEIIKATADLIDSCAEIAGVEFETKPSEALTVADGQKVVKLAQGGGDADFA
jgi:hypothetical protein